MNTKTKILTIVVLSAVALTLVCLPLTMAMKSSCGLGDEVDFAQIEKECPLGSQVDPKVKLIWWILNKSEPVEIEGTVVMLQGSKLVLDVGTDQVTVQLAEEWIIEGEVVAREELVSCGYLSEGENITIKALRADLIYKPLLSIYIVIGYEIIDDTGAYAHANMDINIEA
jgi:hypothetical protein